MAYAVTKALPLTNGYALLKKIKINNNITMGIWGTIMGYKDSKNNDVPLKIEMDVYEQPEIIGYYGTFPESQYNSLLKGEKTLKLYHDLWRSKIVKLVQEKIELIGNHSGYYTFFFYSMYGLSDTEFRGGIHLLSYYQYHTEEFVKLYPKLKAEVHLLRLKQSEK